MQVRRTVVGLPDAAVKESQERIRAAFRNCALKWPYNRVTVNLAPADLKKMGPAYDLPIALGLLIASDQLDPAALEGALVVGELALDGGIRHARGVLPMTAFARERGYKRIIVPACDAPEAALVHGIDVIAAATLIDLVVALNGRDPLTVTQPPHDGAQSAHALAPIPDFRDIKGQEVAKRALEIAAAGGHNAIMKGSPGAGKTLLARAMPGILPDLSMEEALEATRIYSVADALPPDMPLIRARPFRAPHHTVSHAGLVGGGKIPRPGEISLAHRGVLFLDELPEFDSRALEVLRQPLEDKVVTISRASGSLTFPASFQLIAAMNPCKCGWFGDAIKECTCAPAAVLQYQKKISGPLLDRIDIFLDVQRVNFEKLSGTRAGECSEAVRARVQAARAVQARRFISNGISGAYCNADMRLDDLSAHCALDEAGTGLMKVAMNQLNLSARAYHRVLKLARTIADLASAERIGAAHLAEALQYRPRRGD
jgi:magnesium chelatase family protein